MRKALMAEQKKNEMQTFYSLDFLKQQLCIFSQKLSNKNKQRLYKIQKCPTSLFYHALLIKQNECNSVLSTTYCKCYNVQNKVDIVKEPTYISMLPLQCQMKRNCVI